MAFNVVTKFAVDKKTVTKYDMARIRQFNINGQIFPFAKLASAVNNAITDAISFRTYRMKLLGNSTQQTGSVPVYTCRGHSRVIKIGSQIRSNDYDISGTDDGLTHSTDKATGEYEITGTATSTTTILIAYNKMTLASGHKYLVPAYGDTTGVSYYYWGNVAVHDIPAANVYVVDADKKYKSWAIVTGDGVEAYNRFRAYNGISYNDISAQYSNAVRGHWNIIDLTELYGAGSEPANPATVFQDHPEIPVNNDSWCRNDAIQSIDSITFGDHTESITLRSAGTVYDEWASNGHGTRKVSEYTILGTETVHGSRFDGTSDYIIFEIPIVKAGGSIHLEGQSTIPNTTTVTTSSTDETHYLAITFTAGIYANLATALAAITGSKVCVPLTTSASITTTPLTLASGLTPTDQNGDPVTFTEGTEATPSPNYPVPIVNSTQVEITDGTESNTASIDLAGLTDKDEIYVNVKSTNLWDEEYETGRYNNTTGEKEPGDGTRIRNKTPIPCKVNQWYYRDKSKVSNIYFYDSNGDLLSYFNDSSTDYFQTPADTAFLCFFTVAGYGTTYKNDINISETSQNVPVPYMPHNTKGKVWYKRNVGSFNIGSYSWNKVEGTSVFFRTVADKLPGVKSMLCSKYKYRGGTGFGPGNYEFGDSNNASYLQYVFIHDDDYADPASFRAGNVDIIIYYNTQVPTWTDITATTIGVALMALQTIESNSNSNTISVNNGGDVEDLMYFQIL